jgi:hypothetical protein
VGGGDYSIALFISANGAKTQVERQLNIIDIKRCLGVHLGQLGVCSLMINYHQS